MPVRAFASLVFAVLVGYPVFKIAGRVDFLKPIPFELFPTALFSVKQAGLSLVASLAVGIPLGVFYSSAWSRWLRGLMFATFSLPALLVVGMFNDYGLGVIVLAHAYLNAPWIAWATAEGVRSVPFEGVQAARTLGATRARAFLRIELPWISSRISVAAAQVFALCLMSFTIVLVLGGGPPVSTLETEIYAAVRGGGLDLSKAAWFALVQCLLSGLPLFLVASRRPLEEGAGGRSVAPVRQALALAVAAIWLLLPGILFFRFLSISRIESLFESAELLSAIGVSLRIAIFSSVATLVLGLLFAFSARDSRLARALAALPIGLSPLLVALGFFLAYSEWIDPFEGSLLGMVLVQAVLFLPFTLRFFLPLVRKRESLLQVARTLGASPVQAWFKLEWPRWRATGVRLLGLVFIWSFSEFAVTNFFGSERLMPVGVLLKRWMSQYRFEDANVVLFGIFFLSSLVLLAVGLHEEGKE